MAVETRAPRPWVSSREPGGRPRRAPAALGARPPEGSRAARWVVWALVAGAVLFNAWILRAEAQPVLYPNDNALHVAMVEWATNRIQDGHLPLDGWFPNLAAGSAQFHHYQSLPHIVTGFLGVFFGPHATFAAVQYLLLVLWPLCIYWSIRLLRWDVWTAGLAALVSSLLVSAPALTTLEYDGYGFEFGAYVWRGYGMWSQLWGMWLLPLALALTWRAVARRGSVTLAAGGIALTVACHYMTGYLAFLSLGAMTLLRPSEFRPRLKRGALIAVMALGMVAWVVVPVLADSRFIPKDEWLANTPLHDSFGARQVLGWLVTGRIFDGTRFPVVTAFVLLGLLVSIARWRTDERVRVPVVFFGIGLLLFFGRPTLGPILDLLPASRELFLHRYVIGVHLGGIMLAGIGLAWLGRAAFDAARSVLPRVRAGALVAAVLAVLFLLLSPAWRERAFLAAGNDHRIREQAEADASDGRHLAALRERIAAGPPGRVYAGSTFAWEGVLRVGGVAVLQSFVQSGVDSIGYALRVGAITTPVEPRFDETDPAHYDMFNVRYLILGEGEDPAVPAERIARSGPYALWQVPTNGYVQVVDLVGPAIVADRTDIGPETAPFLSSGLAGRGVYRAVAFAGGHTPPPTTSDPDPDGPAGSVIGTTGSLDEGSIQVEIQVDRPSAVLLKASFDPRWRVSVDGVAVEPRMLAPTFVGREVAPGRHTVGFTYVPFPRYDLLLALALVTLFASPMVAVIRRRLATTDEH